METYSFEDFVGDQAAFFAEYFNRRPLLRKGALAGRIADLPSARELDDILALEATPPSYLRVSKGGRGVPINSYTRTVAHGSALAEAINPEKVYELFRSGGTITWNSMQHFLPSTRWLVEVFAETFACNTEVVLFATPAGHDGFAPHHDSVDVFVVQVEGAKTWKVWSTPDDRRGDEASFTFDDLGQPLLEVTLDPGDVLYVPHGTAHSATAKGELSLHISVGVEPRRWRDLVRETVDAIVEHDDFQGFPALRGRHDAGLVAELATKLAALTDRLAEVDLAAEVTRLTQRGRNRNGGTPRREFARLSAVDGLEPTARVRRSTVPVDIGQSDGGRTGLTVNGHRLAVPDAVVSALRALAVGRMVTAAEFFPGVSESRSLHTAQGLARLGVLEIADDKRK